MAYKDKDKQREADRERQQRRRDKIKAKGVTSGGVTQGVIVTPKIQDTPEFSIPNYGLPNCQCKHCQQNRANNSKHIINHGSLKPNYLLADNELNRVTLPGDPDYIDPAGTRIMNKELVGATPTDPTPPVSQEDG